MERYMKRSCICLRERLLQAEKFEFKNTLYGLAFHTLLHYLILLIKIDYNKFNYYINIINTLYLPKINTDYVIYTKQLHHNVKMFNATRNFHTKIESLSKPRIFRIVSRNNIIEQKFCGTATFEKLLKIIHRAQKSINYLTLFKFTRGYPHYMKYSDIIHHTNIKHYKQCQKLEKKRKKWIEDMMKKSFPY